MVTTASAAADHVDVTVEIVNGTDRQPGRADLVAISELEATGRQLDSTRDVTGQVVFAQLQLDAAKQYLIHAQAGGVDYYARRSGADLAREQAIVYTFSHSSSLDGVTISGMNVVLRRRESTLAIEYILTIENQARPQVTVVPDPATLELAFPAGCGAFKAENLRGPEPTPVASRPGSSAEFTGFALNLIPGSTQVRVTTTVHYGGELGLPIGANLPVTEWSLLAFPPDLEIIHAEFSPGTINEARSYRRFVGSPLDAGRVLQVLVGGGTPPKVAERVFTQASDGDPEAAAAGGESALGIGFGQIAVVLVLALLAAVVVRVIRSRQG